ncbi:reverse transcriptase domain-containing protein [Tanacetum coccineum]
MIACTIGKLKFMNALADQGSDVNIMPLTIYNKLTSEKPMETNVILSLTNHSYVYPVGIAKDVLVEVASFVYLVDFVILDIDESMTKADIRCSDESMTLRTGKFKVRFIKTLRFPKKVNNKERNDLDPMIPTNHMNRRILEWEKRIERCKEDEIEFSKLRSKVFDDKNLVGHNFFIYDHDIENEDDSSVMNDGVT